MPSCFNPHTVATYGTPHLSPSFPALGAVRTRIQTVSRQRACSLTNLPFDGVQPVTTVGNGTGPSVLTTRKQTGPF
jgi:hypothetical protein